MGGYTYSLRVPRGGECGIKIAQRRDGTICVTGVLETLSHHGANPLCGRIGIYDTIVRVGAHVLTGRDSVQDVIRRLKVPPDLLPLRVTFLET